MTATQKTRQPLNLQAIRSHYEIARIFAERGEPISRARVWQLEQRALRKLRAHPEIQALADELGGE